MLLFPLRRSNNVSAHLRGGAVSLASAVALLLSVASQAQIDRSNWGSITAPVFGTSEGGVYAGAELFAGPNKFAQYFHGVLPNGRIVRPAGDSAQIGMNPLGCALTPDGKYLVTTNDDERDGGLVSLKDATNIGGYSLTVVDTSTLKIASQISTAGKLYMGLQITGAGPYRVWASGGPDNNVKLFTVSASGAISVGSPAAVTISPITPANQGFVSNYTIAAAFAAPFLPTGFSTSGAKITFPAGSALSGKYLYVACNGDNSIAVIDTTTATVVNQVPAGYFPYGVAVSSDGKLAATNWGVTEYKFLDPHYDSAGGLVGIGYKAGAPDGFYVPPTSTGGSNPKTSSVSLYDGAGSTLSPAGAIYMGQPGGIDALNRVGDTHPSGMAIVRRGGSEILYVTKANNDSIGLIDLTNRRRLPDLDLSPVDLGLADHKVHGAYPNAIVVAPNNQHAFVAEAGLNSIAVLDTTDPSAPKLVGRIPTGWYPTALAINSNGTQLYVVNAKGIGEDINPATVDGAHHPTGVESFSDGNFIFGTVQRIFVPTTLAKLDHRSTLGYNFAVNTPQDTTIVPAGGAPSPKIKHVFFILHENKTFDSELGNLGTHFGPFASLTYNAANGSLVANSQFTPVSLNLQTLSQSFATAVNYYSDSEESDAGHQFAMSGTASDYTEKTLLVKTGRGLLVNKNFEPEDYPEGGYVFNNAARNGVSFKEYGIEAARIIGTDTGGGKPAKIDDPTSGNAGYPTSVAPLVNVGDGDSATQGVGHSFFMKFPGLAVLGAANSNGEPRIDLNYPGYNFSISDQRRALEFIKDFDRMAAAGTLPQFLYIYEPSDHTGTPFTATNVSAPTAAQQVADGDVGLGMVVNHIMNSPVYYDAASDTGSAIFITFDDAQSTLDHIHEHRTPLVVVSPFAKTGGVGNGYIGKRHYSTASVVKTEELLLGLPPNNLGDLFATDLRDLFQDTYNGIKPADLTFTRIVRYAPSAEGRRVWALAKRLDVSGPDRDSRRLGALARISMEADKWHRAAEQKNRLKAKSYLALQSNLYKTALAVVQTGGPRDSDD